MKAFCTTCKETKPASFRKFIPTDCPDEYEDLCCDECHTILATIEDRETGTGEKLEAIFYQDENGTRWVYSDDACASISWPDSDDREIGRAVLYLEQASNARVQAAAEGGRACNDLLGDAPTTENK